MSLFSNTNVNAIPNSAVVNVDWYGFEKWLESRGRKHHQRLMLRYARKYCGVLFSGQLSELEGVPSQNIAMQSLANLSKYLGIYGWWQERKRACGLKWKTTSAVDVFQKIYENETNGIKDWLEDVLEVGDDVLSFPTVLMGLTGLRTSEALMCLERIKKEGMDGYLKDGVLLEHFRFKEFLRGNKNCYVSIVVEKLLPYLKAWDKHVSYTMLVKRCRKYGLKIRFYDLRKWYATALRMSGIPSEICDLLEGRIAGSVFVQSYLRPDFKEIIEKVRAIIRPYAEKWLS